MENKRNKFALGQTVATPFALKRVGMHDITIALNRHLQGDWGEVTDSDREENELSLKEGFRILSVYRSESGEKFWIITEADRSQTTVLMPEDY